MRVRVIGHAGGHGAYLYVACEGGVGFGGFGGVMVRCAHGVAVGLVSSGCDRWRGQLSLCW